MTKYQGAIDYTDLENKLINKRVIILMDNHKPDRYCDIKAENIDRLLLKYYDKSTTYIFEELLGEEKFIEIFPDIDHQKQFMEFYNKYRKSNDKKIYPVDIRNFFDNSDSKTDYIFNNLDILFNLREDNSNKLINKIKQELNISLKNSNEFKNHYNIFLDRYQELKNSLTKKEIDILKKNKYPSYYPNMFIAYPFLYNKVNKDYIIEEYHNLLSGLMELYSIAIIFNTDTKYYFLYMGASHGILIHNLLKKYYNFNVKKELDNRVNMNGDTVSCINFPNI
jgi:hypothetical protein